MNDALSAASIAAFRLYALAYSRCECEREVGHERVDRDRKTEGERDRKRQRERENRMKGSKEKRRKRLEKSF
jgi:hypothetical protein